MTVLRLMFSRKWILTTVLVVLGSLICTRLGIWQLDRLEQRRAFNTHYLETNALPSLNITSALTSDLTSMEYRHVTVTGTYDFENQVALRNQVYENQPGYQLLTPVVLADGTAILVERGWIPVEVVSKPADWRIYDQPGSVTVSGIIRLGQTEPAFGGADDPELAPGQIRLDVWNLANVSRISQQLPYKIAPFFIQPNPDATLSKPPYPSQPEIELTEGSHFGYALTWFSFAMLLFFGYPLAYLPRQIQAKPAVTFEEK